MAPNAASTTNRRIKTEAGYAESIVLEYKTGKSALDVAQVFGITEKTVLNLARKVGITRLVRVSQQVKDEIIRLYTEEQMTPREIGPRVGMSEAAVGTHINKSGKSRSVSEAQALAANRRPFKKGRGGYWQSTKTQKWVYAMSIMEMLRMQQLDADPTVKTWDRYVPSVDWSGGKYVPDLMVTHTDGTVFVEEVKPTSQHHYEENQQKWQAAIAHFSAIGIGFRIVTEHTVGGEKAIRGFRTEGLQTIDDTERKKRKKEVYSAYRARNIDRITQKQKIREAKYKNDAEYYSAMLHKRKMAKRAKKQKEKEELCKSNLSFIF